MDENIPLGTPSLYTHLPQSKYLDYVCKNCTGWTVVSQFLNYDSYTTKLMPKITREYCQMDILIMVLQRGNFKFLYYSNGNSDDDDYGRGLDACYITEEKGKLIDGKYVILEPERVILECEGKKETFEVWEGINTWMFRNKI